MKDESKDESINLSGIKPLIFKKNNNIKNDDKKNKISTKKLKLELLKKKEEKYLDIINLQSELKQKNIKKLENQINIQSSKNDNIIKGFSVSETDSKIEYSLDLNMKIENGFAFLSHLFKNHLALLKLDFFQNLLNNSNISNKKLKNVEFRFDKKRTFTDKRKDNLEKDIRNIKKRKKSTQISIKDMDKLQKDLEQRKNHRLSYNYNFQKIVEENQKLNLQPNEEIKEESESNEIKETFSSPRVKNPEEEDNFIQTERLSYTNQTIDKSQLVEYDLFYKEQFFKNDVFKYDVNNIEDKEEKEINREMHKLDVKRRLIAKKKKKKSIF
jgi:hypothetical protein